MTYIGSIKTGFKVVNRNWQLVLIQVGAMFISLFGFFIFIGIPLAIAFTIFGIDLTNLSRPDDIIGLFKRASDLLSQYLGLAILLFTSLIIYLLSVVVIGVFVCGGSIGTIARTIKTTESFHFKTFWTEGKRLFFNLIGFTAIIGASFFILALLGGAVSALVSFVRGQEAALALFLNIFFSLLLLVIGLGLVIIIPSITVFGAAIIALDGQGPIGAIKNAVQYIYKRPQGIYLYCLMFFAFVIINFALILIGILIRLVPLIGPSLSFLYQLSLYFLQSYLNLIMIATILVYYHSSITSLTEKDSTQTLDTSPSTDPRQEGVHPQKGETAQA